MDIFVLFLSISSGENATVLFIPIAINVDSENTSYLVRVQGFQIIFLEALDYEHRWKEENSKPRSCFYLKVSKLVNLTNPRGKKSEIITSSSCKRILIIILRRDVLFYYSKTKKNNKNYKNQIKHKKKNLETKITSKILEGHGKRVIQNGLFVEYAEFVCMKIVYSIFIMLVVRLIAEKKRIN